MKTSYEML